MKAFRLFAVALLLLLSAQSIFAGRYYDSKTGRFLSVDPKAYKYPGVSPYTYCLNNPLSNIDPDGRDVVVLNDKEGAYGFGHNAVVVGNDDDGWTYYSYDGDGKYTETSYDTYSQFEESDLSERYERKVRFETTKKQDDKAKEQGKKETKVKRDGSIKQILNNNCAHLVRNVAKKADIILPNRTIPNKQYDDAKKEKAKREEEKKKKEEEKKKSNN